MSKKWGSAGRNLPTRILINSQRSQLLDEAGQRKQQQAYDAQLTTETARLEAYTEQFDFHNSSLHVVHGDHGRTLIASKDIPAGTILMQCTPAAQFVCNPEESHQGNLALGMQLLATCSNHGHDKKRLTVTDSSLSTDPKLKDAKEYPLTDVFPVLPERLYPSLSDMVDLSLPNPLLAPGASQGQLSLPMPPNLTSKQQQDLLAFIQSSYGIDLYKRCVHIARYNSVLAHGDLPYLLPVEAHMPAQTESKGTKSAGKAASSSPTTQKHYIRDNIKQLHVIPCMEQVAPRMCVFPAMSLLNHSCAPNATPSFFLLPHPDSLKALSEKLRNIPDDERPDVKLAGSHALCVVAVVRAMRPIKAGEEVHINYISLAGVEGSGNLPWLKEFREKSLRGSHGFVCKCERCRYEELTGTAAGDDISKETALLKEKDLMLREQVLCAAVKTSDVKDEPSAFKRAPWVAASECDGITMLKTLYDNPHWKALTKNATSADDSKTQEIHPSYPGNALITRAKSLINDNISTTTETTGSVPPAVILRGSPTVSLPNTLRSKAVAYTGTLTGANTEKAVLQAVKIYDKCLSVLLELVEDDDEYAAEHPTESQDDQDKTEEGQSKSTRPVSLISTAADGAHSQATGAAVSRSLRRAQEAKEVAVVLEAARANLGEHVGDAHWAMMLLNVALGAAYHHAGYHALALAVRTSALASVGAMLWCEPVADADVKSVDTMVFDTPYSVLAKHCKKHWGIHSALSAAFSSVVESAQLTLAQAYAEAHRQGEARKSKESEDVWGDELVNQVKAVVAAGLHMC